MVTSKIIVAWICSFSNEKVRTNLRYRRDYVGSFLSRLKGRAIGGSTDSAIWNSNAIEEFEKMEDVELHVICPVRHLASPRTDYEEKGVHYHFFREQNSSVIRFVLHQLITKHTSRYRKNRYVVSQIIKEIKPDLVHVIGAENPFYSLALLDVPDSIPTIIQLQALLTRLVSITKDQDEKVSFYYKGLVEREIIKKADYIGTPLADFRDFILKNIKPDAIFLDIALAMAQKVNLDPVEKEFDFVYFASNINKAGLEAIESFIIAHQKRPHITLDIVGGYDADYKRRIDERLEATHTTDAVTFEGRLPSHDDVIHQIRKSRFALLPLKMDYIPNTLKEAMANGLPVVTTKTDGTPALNDVVESVLLSEQDDFQAMADNMILLMDNEELQCKLTRNAATVVNDGMSNFERMEKWRITYYACIDEFKRKRSIYDDDSSSLKR